ncbi:MAG: sterol desaturase family protein [Gammaproteobacteria bacterium]
MNALTMQVESLLRLGVFLCLFGILAVCEVYFPRRKLNFSKPQRWLSNISISILNTALARTVIPFAGVAGALLAQEKNLGMFTLLSLPAWLEFVLFLLLFDLVIYFQHRLFHAVPPLWKLHRMHHTDPDYDVTTGNRFHPVSILLSSLIKFALILVTGPQISAVIVAELLLNATSMFNHSNIRIPQKIDRWLRLLIVTPDMHRVHHSTDNVEHNHNFGFNFPWWDRLFTTYKAQPQAGHDMMEIGISGFQDTGSTHLFSILAQPFQK